MVAGPLRELFALAASGDLRVVEGECYPLSEVRRAHEDLAARRTSGKLVLDPAPARNAHGEVAGGASRPPSSTPECSLADLG